MEDFRTRTNKKKEVKKWKVLNLKNPPTLNAMEK
jgi:hypothetical protein